MCGGGIVSVLVILFEGMLLGLVCISILNVVRWLECVRVESVEMVELLFIC